MYRRSPSVPPQVAPSLRLELVSGHARPSSAVQISRRHASHPVGSTEPCVTSGTLLWLRPANSEMSVSPTGGRARIADDRTRSRGHSSSGLGSGGLRTGQERTEVVCDTRLVSRVCVYRASRCVCHPHTFPRSGFCRPRVRRSKVGPKSPD